MTIIKEFLGKSSGDKARKQNIIMLKVETLTRKIIATVY